MKKLCFFSGDITRSGGTEKVAIQIMNGLKDEYDVSVVSLTMEKSECFFPIDKSIKCVSLFPYNPSGIKQFPQIVRRLRKYLLDEKTDILIDIDTILDMFSVPAVKLLKIKDLKLIAWEHFNFNETMGNKLRVPIRKHITKKADVVVTLTKEDQKSFTDYYCGRTQVEQIYNPIFFKSAESEYDSNSKTVISVGRLAKQKGFDYLLDIAEIIQKKHPDWQWLILGEGEERALLEGGIAEKNLTNVRLVGRVENVGDYLNKSAIFALTSRYEGFPLVMIEAKAHKLPVVSFRCKTGPAELVKDGVNGYLVDCFDTAGMAEKICELIENTEKRCAFSDSAALDTEKMDYERILEQWKLLINSLTK